MYFCDNIFIGHIVYTRRQWAGASASEDHAWLLDRWTELCTKAYLLARQGELRSARVANLMSRVYRALADDALARSASATANQP
ncbi:MAG: hypothetical protein PF961_14030 [Planctomycetota bacterium]|jgi:hypothetical protein|nr:hypothetical protein [Planctomycetota bacterium]